MSTSSSSSDCLTLSNGAKVPFIGLGTWKAGKGVVESTVERAIELGYRHLDCACDYGNEAEVGNGIKKAIAKGVIKREELWVTSKLWNTYHAKEHVRPALEKTLKDLQLDYVDLFLIHFPISLKYVPIDSRYPPEWEHDPSSKSGLVFENSTIRETWEGLEACVEAGLVKNIGISNFNCALVMDLLKYAKIKPVMNQIEIHPYLANDTLIQFCQQNGIGIAAFSPFAAVSYIGLFEEAKSVQSLLTHEVVSKIAEKHKKSTAQVLLRWQVERGCCAVPKSVNETRLKENLSIFDFKLSEEDMKELKTLNKNMRFNDPGVFAKYPIWG